jgi:two-component sensor histidine kinase
MSALLETAAYMPHGYCLFWQPWLLTLHAGSDLLIFLSYSAIPLALIIFLNRRPDVRFGGIVTLFAAFIMLCGLTHAISIATLWEPIYVIDGAVKLLTGLVSAATAISLFCLMPKLVAIPSPQQLGALHDKLVAEIEAHRLTLAQLRETEDEVERRIEERTAALARANHQLTVLSHEATHRSANIATVILSLARETARSVPDLKSFMEPFTARVAAISNATSSLLASDRGPFSRLEDVVRGQLAPMIETFGKRIAITGPEVDVDTKAAQNLALAIHELATNALKYGALSEPDGRIVVEWATVGASGLRFRWTETGALFGPKEGPPGFGTKLLTVIIPETLRGAANRALSPGRLVYELDLPLTGAPAGAERPAEIGGKPLVSTSA